MADAGEGARAGDEVAGRGDAGGTVADEGAGARTRMAMVVNGVGLAGDPQATTSSAVTVVAATRDDRGAHQKSSGRLRSRKDIRSRSIGSF